MGNEEILLLAANSSVSNIVGVISDKVTQSMKMIFNARFKAFGEMKMPTLIEETAFNRID